MDYSFVQNLSAKNFRRLTGVERGTFDEMVKILKNAEDVRKKEHKYRGGRKPALSIENKLLLTLDYLREYRTMFHVAQSFGVCEAVACQTIKYVENILINNGIFSLPSKRSLLKSDTEFEFVVIDATETPCERPKKGKNTTILARKNGIL
jgi:hypothetical protein